MKEHDPKLMRMSPRMRGIYEQYRRAQHFLKLASQCKKPKSKHNNLIAAVYPARAIVELILESAAKQELPKFKNKDIQKSRADFEQEVAPKIPYYYLLEKIRIHDFHRFGCLPPEPTYREIFLGGPIKLKAQKGVAAYHIQRTGPKEVATGKSVIKAQRPLINSDGNFYDEDTNEYVSLFQILNDFLGEVTKVINEFENNIKA